MATLSCFTFGNQKVIERRVDQVGRNQRSVYVKIACSHRRSLAQDRWEIKASRGFGLRSPLSAMCVKPREVPTTASKTLKMRCGMEPFEPVARLSQRGIEGVGPFRVGERERELHAHELRRPPEQIARRRRRRERAFGERYRLRDAAELPQCTDHGAYREATRRAERKTVDATNASALDDFAQTFVVRGRVVNAVGRLRDCGVVLAGTMQDMPKRRRRDRHRPSQGVRTGVANPRELWPQRQANQECRDAYARRDLSVAVRKRRLSLAGLAEITGLAEIAERDEREGREPV